MFGKNKQLPVVNEPNNLQIQEVFPTIQGEGPHVGMRAVFIRAGGCNLACHFCDTEFESYKPWTALDLAKHTMKIAADTFGSDGDPITIVGRVLFVLTGGEPARQNFGAFIDAIRELSIRYEFTAYFQIETSGTLVSGWMRKLDSIVVSPKAPKLHPKFKELCALMSIQLYLKYVVDTSIKSFLDLSPSPIGMSFVHYDIYIQPIEAYMKSDDGDKMVRDSVACEANLRAAINLVNHDGRFRLCLQTHKMIGLP